MQATLFFTFALMNKAKNTCKNETSANNAREVFRKGICVFRIIEAWFRLEPGPLYRSVKLPIIFANIRV